MDELAGVGTRLQGGLATLHHCCVFAYSACAMVCSFFHIALCAVHTLPLYAHKESVLKECHMFHILASHVKAS